MKSINKNSEHDLLGLYHSNMDRVNSIIRDQFTLLTLLTPSECINPEFERDRLIKLKLLLNHATPEGTLPVDYSLQKITRKEQQIIDIAIALTPDLFTTTQIKDTLKTSRTLAWNYIERLIKKGIVELVDYGKPSTYRLTPNYLHFIHNERQKSQITDKGGEKKE